MKWLPLVLFIFLAQYAKGQNIISNGSFEQRTFCPDNISLINYATGWDKFGFGSPDYFHSCGATGLKVPANFIGNQAAAHGNAYGGIIVYTSTPDEWKEYIRTNFPPMVPGISYEMAMSVSLADSAGFATDDLGVFFFTNATPLTTAYVVPATPQIDYKHYGLITDKTNWVRLIDTFVTDSAYTNIIIGTFKDDTSMNKLSLSTGTSKYSYYYIDSVVLRPLAYMRITSVDTPICAGSSITASYLVKPNYYNTNNVFSLQLSNSTGSFTGAPTIGQKNSNTSGTINGHIPNSITAGNQYRIRLISSSPADTFVFGENLVIKPGFAVSAANNSPLCSGATLNLSTLFSPGITYAWTGPGGYSSNLANPSRTNVTANMSGDYVLKRELGGCFIYDTTKVLIHPVTPTPVATNNSPVCAGGDIKLYASGIPGASYEWNGPGLFYATSQNTIRNNAALVDGGAYTVVAKVNGCLSAPATTMATVAKGPEISMYPNPGDSLCPGWSVSFAAVPKNAGPTQSFEWYKNGVATGATGQTYNAGIPNTGDSFYVRMTAGSVCNTPINSSTIKITVLPVHTPPTISITADPGAHVWPGLEVKFKAQTGNAGAHPGYQWRLNGQDIHNAKDSIFKADYLKTGDTICCLVYSNYLCAIPREALSNCLVMNVDAGVESGNGRGSGVKIYPNPNDGNFIVESAEDGRLQITNLHGQMVLEQPVKKGLNPIKLSPARGVYMLRIVTNQGVTLTQKIVVE